MQAFQLPSLARAVAESTLRELTGELLYRLLDDRIPRVRCLLYSDANRDVRGFGWERSSRGRYATHRRLPSTRWYRDGTPYRGLYDVGV